MWNRATQSERVVVSAGLLGALAGSIGATWFTLHARPIDDSRIPSGVLVIWVLSPFAAIFLLSALSIRWGALTRMALVGLTLGLTAGTLAVYANVAASSVGSGAGFTFGVVPVGSWLLIATVIPIVSLMSRRLSRYGFVKWTIRGAAAVFVLVEAGISVLLGVLLFDHHRDTILPAPTGPFAVGRTTIVWQREQPDPSAPPDSNHELMGWIWYPAARGDASEPVEYLPAPWRAAMENQSGSLLSQFLTRHLARVRARSWRDAPVSTEQPAYPVVLMRGGGAALTTDYTTLAEDLASHGYIVVGFDVPYRSWVVVLSDGRSVARSPQNNLDNVDGPQVDRLAETLAQAWTADCRFVLDQLERLDAAGRFRGRLDLERVGMFGHSLGGATALLLCHDDSRCKAGIDVDGAPLGRVISEGVTQPFMFILSDHRGEPTTDDQPEFIRNANANIRSIHDRLPDDRRLMVEIRGANHFLFSDNAALLKSPLVMRMLHRLGIVRLEGRRQLGVTALCVRSFFDVHLKGASSAELRGQLDSPEIEMAP